MSPREHLTSLVLSTVDAGSASQRSIARDVGIALGLANLLLKELARRGLVKVTRERNNGRKYRYAVTPAGRLERDRLDRQRFASQLHVYVEARERVRRQFHDLAATSRPDRPRGGTSVAFYGANELAEIAYICLDQVGLVLVGVVDDHRTTPFFGHPVHGFDRLSRCQLAGVAFDKLIMMEARSEALADRLMRAGITSEDVVWL